MIKDKAQSNGGKGFSGSSTDKTQPNTGSVSQAIALSNGLQQTLENQAASLTELATLTDKAADAIAEPIADYLTTVLTGDLLMGKIAQRLTGGANTLEATVEVVPPTLPATPKRAFTPDFLAAPKRVQLPGS